MGPRFESRGDTAVQDRFGLILDASMGPRFESRGDVTFQSAQYVVRYCLLQWGRALKAAEMFYPLVTKIVEVGLQWGRALKAAEIQSPGTAARTATTLQWGRALKAAEMRRTPTSWSGTRICFNGAAL